MGQLVFQVLDQLLYTCNLDNTWSYHNFMFLGSDSQEGEVICWINISNGASGFISKLVYKTGILNCGGVVHSCPDRNT